MRIRAFSSALVLLLASTATAAKIDSTDPTVDVQLFYPAPGARNFFSVESGNVNSHMGFNIGLNLDYARNPLAVRILKADETEEDVGSVVGNRLDLNLMGAIGLANFFDLGFVMPLTVQGGFDQDAFEGAGVDVGPDSIPMAAPGDLRLVPKIRFIHSSSGSFAAAIVPTVVVPTGSADYARENAVVFAPSLAFSGQGDVFRAALNLGYRYRDRTQTATLVVDDEYFFRLGAGLRIAPGSPVELIGEVYGHTPVDNVFAGKSAGTEKEIERSRTAVEGDVGVRIELPAKMTLQVGAGGGLMPGYGAPAPRVIASLMYYTGDYAEADTDQDTVVDSRDKCPDKKEDLDQFEDDDGCPDVDNDGDNISDDDDQCKNEPEDKDGFQDEDGCPDPDDDQDGLLDAADKCPRDAEDKDGFQDEDGCPDPDNDNDGVLDADDKCPLEAEDIDGYLDFDGCPEADNDEDGLADLNDLCPNHPEDKDGVADDDGCPEDNDGDGIADELDKCPDKAEIYNGIEDSDGCPEALQIRSLVNVTEEKIEIKETILFATGKAVISPKSFGLLDQVVAVLKNYKQIKKVRIEGHTDDRGAKKKNVKLSQDRADSVRAYLVGKGIEPQRLESQGFGPDKPIASNKTNKGREANRRVEFMIAEKTPIGKDVAADQPMPAPAVAPLPVELPKDAAPPTGDQPVFEIEAPPGTAPAPATTPTPTGKKDKKGKKKGETEEQPKPAEGGVDFNF